MAISGTPTAEGVAGDFTENPFVVTTTGFYRRWIGAIEDRAVLEGAVARLTDTVDEAWVPVFREVGQDYERQAEAEEAAGDTSRAAELYDQAKNYYSIARFPRNLTPLKELADADCNRVCAKAGSLLDPPMQTVEIVADGKTIVGHFRAPKTATADQPVGGVLVMCGADVYKEDRTWCSALAVEHGLAALVVDAPGTGQNPFPMALESVVAWKACLDFLAAQPQVDEDAVGGFGISRGGHSVLLLAGSYPERFKAGVANACSFVGYELTQQEKQALLELINRRSDIRFGGKDDGPSFAGTTMEGIETDFQRWSLAHHGIVDKIKAPLLMINGKKDTRAPVGNIYFMLEHGPVTGREARVYPDDGHCAPNHVSEWAPAAFQWLSEKLQPTHRRNGDR